MRAGFLPKQPRKGGQLITGAFGTELAGCFPVVQGVEGLGDCLQEVFATIGFGDPPERSRDGSFCHCLRISMGGCEYSTDSKIGMNARIPVRTHPASR
jgi:hypothetical protein